MAENKKVLIVEDEESLAIILKKKLEQEGYEATISYDGEAGYDKIGEFKPDLILLDIVMPKMNGFDVMEKMKKNEIKIPIIIISNSGQPVEIEKAKKLGAVDHLVKTELEPSEVIEKVQEHFKSEKNCEEEGGECEPKKELKVVGDSGTKVLLVEDDSFLRDICAKKLAKENFSVYEAVDGEQAISEISRIKPDIVLLDIILPAIDGFGVLEKIRSHRDEKIKKVPIIMLSNLGQKDDINKAMELGANNYLIKAHFTTEEIISKIQKELGK